MKYILTISRTETYGAIKRVLNKLDLHHAVVQRETGNGGYEHYQLAVDCAGDLREYADRNHLGWHIENAVDWEKSVKYCRKSGNYSELGNRVETREYYKHRARKENTHQTLIRRSIENQNDRTITVWIDRKGNSGKSTLLYYMARDGQVCVIPRTEQTASRVSDYVAMCYDDEPIIWLDLPRSRSITKALCEALEDIKDGIVQSSKYQGHLRLIRGVKIVITTNNWIAPDVYKSLSEDRWDIHTIENPLKFESEPTR